MRNVETLGELLDQLECVQSSLDHAWTLLNDTGDFESEDLDTATTIVDKARTLVESAYNKFNQ
jgi:hypothetical protein